MDRKEPKSKLTRLDQVDRRNIRNWSVFEPLIPVPYTNMYSDETTPNWKNKTTTNNHIKFVKVFDTIICVRFRQNGILNVGECFLWDLIKRTHLEILICWEHLENIWDLWLCLERGYPPTMAIFHRETADFVLFSGTLFRDKPIYMGISIVMGDPQNGWFIGENPVKMGWFGGTPILGNPHICFSRVPQSSWEYPFAPATAPHLSQGMPACASTTNFPFLVSCQPQGPNKVPRYIPYFEWQENDCAKNTPMVKMV